MKFPLLKKDGSALIWVICVFVIVILFSVVIVSSVYMTLQSTEFQHNTQQAYFSAKSAASTVANYILQNDGDPDIVTNLTLQPGTGGSKELGEYTVKVSYQSSSKIKVEATSIYKREKRTVSVYLVKPPIPAGIIPTDQLIFINGGAASGFGQSLINGSVFVDGDLNISEGSKINGIAVVKGKATISGGASTSLGVVSFGDLTLNNGAVINGDVFTQGDFTMTGGSRVTGNAYADGSLDFWNGGDVLKNVAIGKNAKFAGGGSKIKGNFTYGGDLTFGWGNINSYVVNIATKIPSYTPLDFSKYNAPDLPIIRPPTQFERPELYNTVTVTNKTINQSGTFTSSVLASIGQMPYSSILTIDASNSDIHLLLKDNSLNLTNGVNIEVIGTNNVYLYMTGTASISVNSNEYIGMAVRGANPHLFIFGDGAQSINLQSNSELNACVYMPSGKVSASGNSLTSTTYKFVGSCIVKEFAITSDVKFQYSKPNLDDSPLDIFQSGNSDSGYAGWAIESWDSK